MHETWYTVRREMPGMVVDYPTRHRTHDAAEAYARELAAFSIGGGFTVVEHTAPRKATFRF